MEDIFELYLKAQFNILRYPLDNGMKITVNDIGYAKICQDDRIEFILSDILKLECKIKKINNIC